jgi:hypothetical protein
VEPDLPRNARRLAQHDPTYAFAVSCREAGGHCKFTR